MSKEQGARSKEHLGDQLPVGVGPDQSGEHPTELGGPWLEMDSRVDHPSRACSLEPVLGLTQRATSDEEEPSLISQCPSAKTLGDVGTDGISGANELNPDRPQLELGPLPDETVDLIRQRCRQLVGEKAPVPASPHCHQEARDLAWRSEAMAAAPRSSLLAPC